MASALVSDIVERGEVPTWTRRVPLVKSVAPLTIPLTAVPNMLRRPRAPQEMRAARLAVLKLGG